MTKRKFTAIILAVALMISTAACSTASTETDDTSSTTNTATT